MTGLSAYPTGTLLDRVLAELRAGPARSNILCAGVLGMPNAPRAVAERLLLALLGADPRVHRLADGRWALVAEAQDSPLLDECAFAVVDVETTGMRARGGDRITEIAVVVVQGGRRELVYESLVNPERSIPAMIARMTRISDDMVRSAPRFADIADDVLGALGGRVFVAHNARFDWSFVSAELDRARDVALDGPRVCTVRLARKLVREVRSCGLDNLSHHFGLGQSGAPPRGWRRDGHGRPAGPADGARPREGRSNPAGPRGHGRDASHRGSAQEAVGDAHRTADGFRVGRAAVTLTHSFTVGKLRCHTLEGGLQRLDGGAMFGVVPKPLWERQIAPDERNRIPLAMRCLLVEHDDGLVLIDTSVGTKEDQKFTDIYGIEAVGRETPSQLEDALLQLGYRPDDIKWVINTHLHFDHAGGNTYRAPVAGGEEEGELKLTFPNATYVVQRGELEFARNTNERTRASYFPANFEPIATAGKFRLLNGDQQILPGISARLTPGHVPWHQAVLVEDGGETAAFVADLVGPHAAPLDHGI